MNGEGYTSSPGPSSPSSPIQFAINRRNKKIRISMALNVGDLESEIIQKDNLLSRKEKIISKLKNTHEQEVEDQKIELERLHLIIRRKNKEIEKYRNPTEVCEYQIREENLNAPEQRTSDICGEVLCVKCIKKQFDEFRVHSETEKSALKVELEDLKESFVKRLTQVETKNLSLRQNMMTLEKESVEASRKSTAVIAELEKKIEMYKQHYKVQKEMASKLTRDLNSEQSSHKGTGINWFI